MYELESLEQTSRHNWTFVIRKPSGRRETMTWFTKDSVAEVKSRAQRIVDRWNVDYGLRAKTRPASSHWRAMATTSDQKTNLNRLKQWNTERIKQHKAALAKRGQNNV